MMEETKTTQTAEAAKETNQNQGAVKDEAKADNVWRVTWIYPVSGARVLVQKTGKNVGEAWDIVLEEMINYYKMVESNLHGIANLPKDCTRIDNNQNSEVAVRKLVGWLATQIPEKYIPQWEFHPKPLTKQ
jgi:hypothetical protein